jgi:hypothetical protein
MMLLFPINIIVVINLINIIIPYSPIKINANNPPLYSMLNPDTISDSPSLRSKGVRLVSAKHSITHPKKYGIKMNSIHKFSCIIFKVSIFIVFLQ